MFQTVGSDLRSENNAVDVLHDNKWGTVCLLAAIEDAHNVGVIHAGERLEFLKELTLEIRLGACFGEHHLDGDSSGYGPEESLVVGHINYAHAAGGDFASDTIAARQELLG